MMKEMNNLLKTIELKEKIYSDIYGAQNDQDNIYKSDYLEVLKSIDAVTTKILKDYLKEYEG